MRKKVLVIVVLVALFGFNLVTPLTDFESYSGQSTEQDAFTMSGIGDNTEDYVDQISNLHAPTDLGTHSVFADLQDYGSNYDQMQEENTGGGGGGVQIDDYVDQISDVDSVADLGTHDAFTDLQASDNTYNNISEAAVGGPGGITFPSQTISTTSGDGNCYSFSCRIRGQ